MKKKTPDKLPRRRRQNQQNIPLYKKQAARVHEDRKTEAANYSIVHTYIHTALFPGRTPPRESINRPATRRIYQSGGLTEILIGASRSAKKPMNGYSRPRASPIQATSIRGLLSEGRQEVQQTYTHTHMSVHTRGLTSFREGRSSSMYDDDDDDQSALSLCGFSLRAAVPSRFAKSTFGLWKPIRSGCFFFLLLCGRLWAESCMYRFLPEGFCRDAHTRLSLGVFLNFVGAR